jgi:hypothetical protein
VSSIFFIHQIGIEPLAQLLARLEEGHPFFLDEHRIAGPRIAAGAGRTVLHGEGAETAQFHAIAGRQRVGDLVQNGIDDVLDVAVVEVRITGLT